MGSILSNQCHILATDDPSMYTLVPGDLHVLAVGLERLQHFNMMALQDSSQRTGQNVVLLHVVIDWQGRILESLLGADKLVPQVEKLFQSLASQHEL